MDPALANLGWTEDQWNRICSAVVEEAQKARIAAQMLPTVGPEEPTTLAVPMYTLGTEGGNPGGPPLRLTTNSDPELFLTRIDVNIHLRSHEAADPTLSAALLMFRRAANVIARVEDALVFYGRRNSALGPPPVSALNAAPIGIPLIYGFTRDTHNVSGLFQWRAGPSSVGDPPPLLARNAVAPPGLPPAAFRAAQQMRGGALGDGVVNAVIAAINAIEANGYPGPFACALSNSLFEAVCAPTPNLILPRDRILPFLQGPLLRSSVLGVNDGIVVSLAGGPVEIVVASDIQVRFLQQTADARLAFRVSERVALRIKDPGALQRISRL